VKQSFNNPDLLVYCNQKDLISKIEALELTESNLLFMSSGNFSGIELKEFAEKLINKLQ